MALVWAGIVCLLLAHNAYLWLGKRITPDTDIMALLPVQQRDPVLQLSFTHMVDAAQQRVIVLIGASDWNDAKRSADAYSAVLQKHSAVISATPLTEQTQQDWLALFQAHRSVLMARAEHKQLQQLDESAWIDAAMRQLYSPFSGPKLGAWRDDPFGLFAGWVQERAQETPVRPRDGYLFVTNSERQYVLLSLTVHDSVFSISTQQAVTSLLNQARAAALQVVPQSDLITAGVILHAAAAGQQASGEVWTIGLGSLLGVILLMWFTFHSLKPILMILLSITIGCLGSLSICWLLFEHIHLLTLVFGASLIGVAQDYGLFFLCHRLNADARLDSHALLQRLLPSLALTLVAAIIGYMGLAFTPFPGLRNMAVFSALGLLFAWLTVICWFPYLVKANAIRAGALASWYDRTLAGWPRWINSKTSWLILICGSVVVIAGIAKLAANDDIRLLQNSPQQLITDQIKLSRLLDAPTPVQFFLVRADSEQSLLEREEALKSNLDPLVDQHKISGYQAISNWVPSRSTQQANLAVLQSGLFIRPLHQLAKNIDEDLAWENDTRQHMMDAGQLLTVAQFMDSPASEPWRHLWLGKTEHGYASIVALRGLAQANLSAIQHAGSGVPGVQWVDKVAEISGVLGQYRQYMAWVVSASYLLVFGLLFTRYRGSSWRVLLPTALASLITLAILGWTQQPVQLFHVLAFMLLLGIGVDYGIFMQEAAPDNPRTAWLAIGLSAVNTLLSFGLLGLSQTPALHSFGLTMLIGIAMVWIIVPIFRKDKPHDQPH
ncbi:putative exporter [Oxalobacteraceae bacterium GrIS 2.11]